MENAVHKTQKKIPYYIVEKWYKHLQDHDDDEKDNPFNVKREEKESKNIPVTSIVQFLRNRELGVRKPHTKKVRNYLGAREHCIKKAEKCRLDTCLMYNLGVYGHTKTSCYEHHIHRGLEDMYTRNRIWGETSEHCWPFEPTPSPPPSTSCQSSEYDADSDHESEESYMRELRFWISYTLSPSHRYFARYLYSCVCLVLSLRMSHIFAGVNITIIGCCGGDRLCFDEDHLSEISSIICEEQRAERDI